MSVGAEPSFGRRKTAWRSRMYRFKASTVMICGCRPSSVFGLPPSRTRVIGPPRTDIAQIPVALAVVQNRVVPSDTRLEIAPGEKPEVRIETGSAPTPDALSNGDE